jgi:FKBP12-rapamycin complex-associated protein
MGNMFQHTAALKYIRDCRDLLDTDLTALVGESYSRAYSLVVRVQQLAELEEVISYKESKDFPERRELLKETWKERLLGCQVKYI